MKRILSLILLVFLLLFVFCFSAVAHSGRTDSSGGHYDHSSGEYHYHHGEPAHQHPNGECPYDSSGKILELDYGTFFGCMLAFTFLFGFLTFKIGIGYIFTSKDQWNGCLPVIINIVVALVLAFIAIIIIRTVIV